MFKLLTKAIVFEVMFWHYNSESSGSKFRRWLWFRRWNGVVDYDCTCNHEAYPHAF